jgi:hypothetical protein
MLGFIDAELPSGMIVRSMKLMVGPKGRRWVAMPDEKRLDPEGRPVIAPSGKPVMTGSSSSGTAKAAIISKARF